MIDSLTRQLRLGSASRDNVYVISYNDPVPDQAQRVVQALLSIFVESSLGDKRKGTDSARRFIEEQIRAYEKRLEEARSEAAAIRAQRRQAALAEYAHRIEGARAASAQTIEDAVGQIERAKRAARKELEEKTRALGTQIATQVLGRETAA